MKNVVFCQFMMPPVFQLMNKRKLTSMELQKSETLSQRGLEWGWGKNDIFSFHNEKNEEKHRRISASFSKIFFFNFPQNFSSFLSRTSLSSSSALLLCNLMIFLGKLDVTLSFITQESSKYEISQGNFRWVHLRPQSMMKNRKVFI